MRFPSAFTVTILVFSLERLSASSILSPIIPEGQALTITMAGGGEGESRIALTVFRRFSLPPKTISVSVMSVDSTFGIKDDGKMFPRSNSVLLPAELMVCMDRYVQLFGECARITTSLRFELIVIAPLKAQPWSGSSLITFFDR